MHIQIPEATEIVRLEKSCRPGELTPADAHTPVRALVTCPISKVRCDSHRPSLFIFLFLGNIGSAPYPGTFGRSELCVPLGR